MRSTEHQPSTPPTRMVPDDPFDELQGAFYARLRSDLVRLMVLGAALATADIDPMPIFEDIRVFAHRVRGAAALFGAPDICGVAYTLEQAAISAANAHAANSDACVCTALEALTERLATVNGNADPAVPVAPRR